MAATIAWTIATVGHGGTSNLQGFQAHHPQTTQDRRMKLFSGSQRCWFAVDSNFFECSIEVDGRRLQGVILERSRGYSSWIRFGLCSLSFLL